MIRYRYLRLLPIILCLPLRLWAGLVGISYDPNLGQNQIRAVDPLTGATTLLNSFTFSSNSWNPETFSADSQLGRIYTQSGDQAVYTFNAYNGQILHTAVADTAMGAMDIGLAGNLIGISYNPVSMENEVRVLNPSTGKTTLLNTANVSSGGYFAGTLVVAPALNRFYVQSGDATLYTFDLTTGQILNSKLADTQMQELAYWPVTSSASITTRIRCKTRSAYWTRSLGRPRFSIALRSVLEDGTAPPSLSMRLETYSMPSRVMEFCIPST
jgi:outer membrane protein assembly factor BamB